MGEALKNLVKTVADGVNSAAKSLEDGFQVTDLFSLIPLASQIPAVIASKGAIAAEWKARTADTLHEILVELQTDLDLKDDKLEAKIEKAVALVLAGADLYAEFQPAATPPTV